MGQSSSIFDIPVSIFRPSPRPQKFHTESTTDVRSPVSTPQDLAVTQMATERPKKLANTSSASVDSRFCPESTRSYTTKSPEVDRIDQKPCQTLQAISVDARIQDNAYVDIDVVRRAKPIRTMLPSIPTEILLVVARSLPLSSIISLNYSCKVVHSKMDVSIQEILGEDKETTQLVRYVVEANPPEAVVFRDCIGFSQPPMMPIAHRLERLELLCMLDRDRKLPLSKAVCSGCANMHERSSFSGEALAESCRERYCTKYARRIWICPHWIFDHNLVNTSTVPQGHHHCGNSGVVLGTVVGRPYLTWPIATFRENDEMPRKSHVDRVLSSLDIPVCTHVRLCNTYVSSLYSPDCKKIQCSLGTGRLIQYCRCSACVLLPPQPTRTQVRYAVKCGKIDELEDGIGCGKCETCGTNFHFRLERQKTGERVLKLHVLKAIRAFRGCSDRTWIEQSTNPTKIEGIERAWYTATR